MNKYHLAECFKPTVKHTAPLCLMAAILTALPTPTGAEPWHNLLKQTIDSREPFADAAVIDLEEMDDLRGGFTIGGMDINFGATVQTMVNSVRYETVLRFNQDANQVETIAQGIVSGAPTPPAGQQVIEVGPGSGISVQSVTPDQVSLPGVKDFSGIVINGSEGFTAALHDVTRSAILSTVVSNASNQQIQQKLNIDVQITNGRAIQAAQARARLVNSLLP